MSHVSRDLEAGPVMDLWTLACFAVLLSGLGALAVIDFRTGYLPDPINAALGIAGLAVAVIGSPVDVTWKAALIGAALNAAVFYGLRWIVTKMKGREAMGLGDVKLVAVGGLWLGPWALPYIMAAGGLLTLIGIGIASLITRKPLWRGEMPLGPGLCAGILGAFIAALIGIVSLAPLVV